MQKTTDFARNLNKKYQYVKEKLIDLLKNYTKLQEDNKYLQENLLNYAFYEVNDKDAIEATAGKILDELYEQPF